jgi:hypothetical protein
MAHGHAGAFDLDCFDCQVWADSADPDSPRRYRSNLPSAGRVAPRSSRIIVEGLHRPLCACSECTRTVFGFRLLAWVVHQLWDWTPIGQAAYWGMALLLVHLYS